MQWGFKVSRYDQRIHIFCKDDEFIVLAIVVDDLIFAFNLDKLKNT